MTKPMEYSGSAVVTMKIRVTSNGHWGENATVQEVMRIGGRETVQALKSALAESKLRYEIVGEPEVGAVTWARAK